MKPSVAIVCSGLGRVRRGNEAWAHTVAEALHAADWPVTLFGGGPLETQCPYVQLPNLPRESLLARFGVSWHYRYLFEQLTYAKALQRYLRRQHFPLIHVADPALGQRMQRAAGGLHARLVYKDGLLLGPPWCRQFDVVQVLAPAYLEAARRENVDVSQWFVIPHLVDTKRFQPATDRAKVRRELFGDRIPADATVVLAVGDLSPTSNKRPGWILEELASVPEAQRPYLVVIGQASPIEAQNFREQAVRTLGARAVVLTNISPTAMPAYFQAADIFAHGALREPFGIVFLEAMASGLPIVAHHYEVTQWIVGDAGVTLDMEAKGACAAQLQTWAQHPTERAAWAERARARACEHFSPAKIVPLYEQMYRQIAPSALKS